MNISTYLTYILHESEDFKLQTVNYININTEVTPRLMEKV